MELVSIVIPAYNAEKTIQRAVDSLLNQTYQNIEIIIVNDGSCDGTESICSEMIKVDPRVHIITIANSGVSNARNTGIEHCHGDYIAFVDADDYVESEFINVFVNNMDDGVDLVCGGYRVLDECGKDLFTQKFSAGNISMNEGYKGIEILQESKAFNVLWNKMFRKSIIDRANIRMERSVSMGEDLLFVVEYLKNCSDSVRLIAETDYNYVLSKSGLQATFKGDTQLRLNQLEMIKGLYTVKQYPLDGFYLEALRTFYVILLEAEGSKKATKAIVDSSVYQEMRETKLQCGCKFKVFWKILRRENVALIGCFMFFSQSIKRLTGKLFKW